MQALEGLSRPFEIGPDRSKDVKPVVQKEQKIAKNILGKNPQMPYGKRC